MFNLILQKYSARNKELFFKNNFPALKILMIEKESSILIVSLRYQLQVLHGTCGIRTKYTKYIELIHEL